MKTLPKPMTDMEMTDEEMIDESPCPIMATKPTGPRYPWGLRITLTEKELEKLDLDHSSACVGGMVHGHFMARVTSVSQDDRPDGMSCRIELQIEDLAIESEDAENDAEDDPPPRKRSRLYE